MIDFCMSGSLLVMMFVGDIVGKIFCWDIILLLCNYIREYCDLMSVEDIIMINIMNLVKEIFFVGDLLVENKWEIVDNNEGEKIVLDGYVFVEKNDIF